VRLEEKIPNYKYNEHISNVYSRFIFEFYENLYFKMILEGMKNLDKKSDLNRFLVK
jgi:hypothetical protein